MDLNREVAEKVMGWHIESGGNADHWFDSEDEIKIYRATTWNPLKDLNQCFEVVEKLADCLHLREHGKKGMWEATFCGCQGIELEAHGQTPNEAILKAALAATG